MPTSHEDALALLARRRSVSVKTTPRTEPGPDEATLRGINKGSTTANAA